MLPLEPVLLGMEEAGIAVSHKAISESQVLLGERLEKISADLIDIASDAVKKIEENLYLVALERRKSERGRASVQRSSEKYKTKFNWASSDHLAELVYDYYGAKPVYKTKTGKRAVGEQDLRNISRDLKEDSELTPILLALFEYRKVQKLVGTYVEGITKRIENGRIHALYLQSGGGSRDSGGTVTGRLSSQNPNLQNLPRGAGIKQFFVPDPGTVFVYADYSQLELRIAAHLSKDVELMQAYQDRADLHEKTAQTLNITRNSAKTVNFAMIYDASAWRLLQELSKSDSSYTIEDMQKMRKGFFSLYRGYKDYLFAVKSFVQQRGYIYSSFGRIRRLPDVVYGQYLDWDRTQLAPNTPPPLVEALQGGGFQQAKKKFNHAIKQAYNFPIQSFGASLTKRAMIKLHSEGFKVATQVHDSIVIQVPQAQAEFAAKRMQKIMESIHILNVPLVAETKLLNSLEETDKWTQNVSMNEPLNANIRLLGSSAVFAERSDIE
jgi:DNA polymerase-1